MCSFVFKHTQVEKKEIPKTDEIFTPNPKVNRNKNMKNNVQPCCQDTFYQGRYFQSFLWFCLGDCSFLKGLVEVHFFHFFSTVIILIKCSLPCVISSLCIKITIPLKIYLLASNPHGSIQFSYLFCVLFYCLDFGFLPMF